MVDASSGVEVAVDTSLWLRETLEEEVGFVVAGHLGKYLSLRHCTARGVRCLRRLSNV